MLLNHHTIIAQFQIENYDESQMVYCTQHEVKENDWHIDVTGIYQNCVLFGMAIRMV
jgi:hypothetical protein